MMREKAEIAILGAGFSGSLLALVLKQTGREVILIEKGSHPRFAIGESSTPLANLVLENICRTYDLHRLLPLTKYGSWQRSYPELPCGLKRGFSFFKHTLHESFKPQKDHSNELLVAASPADDVGDTHWYREEFDHFLIKEVQKVRVPYFDQTTITAIENNHGWKFYGNRLENEVEIDAEFIVDATGNSGGISGMPGRDQRSGSLRTNSWSVYTHFTGVELWENIVTDLGGKLSDYPFRCDDAALHHIFDDGWMWVLRFNNGVTSAGFVFNGEKISVDASSSAAEIWSQTIARFPSISQQFASAKPTRPFVRTARLQRRATTSAGEDWVSLPHSAYFIDPLLSAGNAHTLIGIERLAEIFNRHWGKTSLAHQLATYNAKLQREIDFLDLLIHGCYGAFKHFEFFTEFSMYYFAGAIYSEHRRRQNRHCGEDEFLFSHHPPFKAAVSKGYETLQKMVDNQPVLDSSNQLRERVTRDIEPYNIAGLCRLEKNNMYPFV